MSAYHFKYFQNIQFKNHGIAPTPPDLPTLKAYPTPGVSGRFEIFSLKWRERMNLKVPGAISPLGFAILSTRAITVRGGLVQPPPLGELGLKPADVKLFPACKYKTVCGILFPFWSTSLLILCNQIFDSVVCKHMVWIFHFILIFIGLYENYLRYVT